MKLELNARELPQDFEAALENLSYDQMAEANERTYVLRAISDLEAKSPTCFCVNPVIISSEGTGAHWKKLICGECGKFFKWLPKPKNFTVRPSSTTGLPAGDFCEICLQPKGVASLQVHHIMEVCDGGTNSLDNLQTVCHSCHELIHWRRRQVERGQ